jgi:hypothetical protein
MNLETVIGRELRTQARRPVTFWFRMAVVGLALGGVAATLPEMLVGGKAGVSVFLALYWVAFWSIWVLMPLTTADCVSLERREGTFGLLFLTPLRTWEIVLAKGLVHGMRGVALLLALAPLLMVPVLMGGVSWQMVAVAVLTLGGSLALALTAGVLASIYSKERNRAYILALALAALFHVGFFHLFKTFDLARQQWGNSSFWYDVMVQNRMLIEVMEHLEARGLELFEVAASSSAEAMALLVRLAWVVVATLFACGTLLLLASFWLRRHWQDASRSRFRLWLEDFFCTPAYAVDFYYRWLKRGLQKNPVGWLEKRRWSGRLATWIWLALAVVMLIGAITYPDVFGEQEGLILCRLCMIGMIIHMGIIATGSFARERATGAMELLLVTPMTSGQIIMGRLRGIWGQFLPALVVLSISREVAAYVPHRPFGIHVPPHSDVIVFSLWYLFALLFAMPIVGLYFSLRLRTFFASLAATFLMVVFVPWLPRLGVGIIGLQSQECEAWIEFAGGYPMTEILSVVILVCLGGFFLNRLQWRLERRQFAFSTG